MSSRAAMVFTRRTLRRCGHTLGMAVVMLSLGSGAQSQEPEPGVASVPCREALCTLALDWRSGVPNLMDRRYGNPYQFEHWLLGHLEDAGYRFAGGEGAGDQAVTIRVAPEMTRAMCDQMPGTDTDFSCQTIGEVRVELLNTDPELDLKHSIRIRGRCGANDFMDISRMAEYVATTIDYELHRREGRRRPSTRC